VRPCRRKSSELASRIRSFVVVTGASVRYVLARAIYLVVH
jgi:hypothetical protein